MARHGQIMAYTQGKPKEEFDIINNEDYKLRLKKTWVEATNVWHIQFVSQSIYERSFECFLTPNELAKLKDSL